MITASDYTKGLGKLDGFVAREILMLKSKNAKGKENPDKPNAPIHGTPLPKDHTFKVGPGFGQIDKKDAYLLVKRGSARPKPWSKDKAEDAAYADAVKEAGKRIDKQLATEKRERDLREAEEDPQYLADVAKAKADAVDRIKKAKK